MVSPQSTFADFKKLCYGFQFTFVYPHVSRLTRAALTALLTAKVQPVSVPFSTHYTPLLFPSAFLLSFRYSTSFLRDLRDEFCRFFLLLTTAALSGNK
jgi:hypothetical protein